MSSGLRRESSAYFGRISLPQRATKMEFIHSHDRDAPLEGWTPCYRLKLTSCDFGAYNEISIYSHLDLLGQCINLFYPAIDKQRYHARKPLDLDALFLSNSVQRDDGEADDPDKTTAVSGI